MEKRGPGPIQMLPERLWDVHGKIIRSSSLTVLYTDRYNGPRAYKNLTKHTFWEFTYIFQGSGIMKSSVSNIPMLPHKMILVPPDTKHSEFSEKKIDTLWIGIDGSMMDFFDRSEIKHVTNPDFEPILNQFWTLSQRPYGLIGNELDGWAALITGKFLKHLNEKEMRADNFIDEAVDYFNLHFSEDISITHLAAKLGYSEGYFYRKFYKRTSMTPIQYLTSIRMRHAIKLLSHSNMPVAEIAKHVGHPDPLYFSRVFRKFTGMNPKSTKGKL